MKQLTCEMCGSTNFIKREGVFVCKKCGCEYSIEEAKKIMEEVAVTENSTNAVDNAIATTINLDNLLDRAAKFINEKNWKKANEYCEKVLDMDPQNSRAAKLQKESNLLRRKANNKKTVCIACVAFLAIVTIIIFTIIIPNTKYNTAFNLMTDGKYEEAISIFEELAGYKDSEDQIDKCYIYNKIKHTPIGDIFTFGKYEQDNISSTEKEEIEWIVLDKEEKKTLIISRYALDEKKYHDSITEVTWETSDIRNWLNNDFLHSAFSLNEQEIIATTTLLANTSPSSNSHSGNDTQDKVFLLSYDEAEKYFSGNTYGKCKATAFAASKGAHVSQSNGNCWWWLRTNGENLEEVSIVGVNGGAMTPFMTVDSFNGAVRPALWVELP